MSDQTDYSAGGQPRSNLYYFVRNNLGNPGVLARAVGSGTSIEDLAQAGGFTPEQMRSYLAPAMGGGGSQTGVPGMDLPPTSVGRPDQSNPDSEGLGGAGAVASPGSPGDLTAAAQRAAVSQQALESLVGPQDSVGTPIMPSGGGASKPPYPVTQPSRISGRQK